MASATIEKIHNTRVAPASDGSVVLLFDGPEDHRIVLDLPTHVAAKLTADLIAAGYGPRGPGGSA